jgi:SCY1-like protein 1
MNVAVAAKTVSDPNRDGWENDEWGSLEEEPANEELEEKANNDMNHLSASRSNSNSQSNSSSGVCNNNIVNSQSPTRNNGGGETLLNFSSNANTNWENNGTGWNDDEFEPIDDSNAGKFKKKSQNKGKVVTFLLILTANSKFDEARRKREEKKLQRQREMEARRAARSGPMKLGVGAKKL